MSRSVLCLLFLSFIILFSCKKNTENPNQSKTETLKDSLIASYPFNNNSFDESGNHYDLKAVGAYPTSDRFGQSNKAYYFPKSGYLVIPKITKADSVRDFTISVWIKPDTISVNGILCFFSTHNACVNSCEVKLLKNWNNLNYIEDPVLTEISPTRCSTTGFFTNMPIESGKWFHIVIVQKYILFQNSPEYYYTRYLNGEKFTSRDYSPADPLPTSFSHGGYIGCSSDGSIYLSPAHNFVGSIDDIRIYNRALSDQEIENLCKLP